MFVRDPFDIAPNASRHTRASWATLVLGLAFLVASGVFLDRSMQAMKQAEDATRQQRELLQSQAASRAAAQRSMADPVALERAKAQQKLQDIMRMSWSGLFDALESAGQKVDGGAVILSLAPTKTQANAAEVGVTALAVSSTIMLDYIRALESNPHVREVQLTMQQPTVNAGASVVRFQLAILWDPRGKTTTAAGASR